jgi:hypothetical protein
LGLGSGIGFTFLDSISNLQYQGNNYTLGSMFLIFIWVQSWIGTTICDIEILNVKHVSYVKFESFIANMHYILPKNCASSILSSSLVNVVYGYTNTLSEYSASTIGYGALGETNVFGCHPFTSTKDTCTFSLSL